MRQAPAEPDSAESAEQRHEIYHAGGHCQRACSAEDDGGGGLRGL